MELSRSAAWTQSLRLSLCRATCNNDTVQSGRQSGCVAVTCWWRSPHGHLNRVLPPASPKMTGVCGGTWKYPFPFWTRFSCSPFTVDTRTRPDCQTHNEAPLATPQRFGSGRRVNQILTVVHLVLFLVHGVDASSGPELQQSLEQQPPQVHYKRWSSEAIFSQLRFCLNQQIFVYKMGPFRCLTLRVGPIRAWEASVLCRHPGSEAVALIQCDGEHLLKKKQTYETSFREDFWVRHSCWQTEKELLCHQVCDSPQFSDQQRTNLAHKPSWSAF